MKGRTYYEYCVVRNWLIFSLILQVSSESASKVEEAQERYAQTLKKKNLAETARKKAEMDSRKLKVCAT